MQRLVEIFSFILKHLHLKFKIIDMKKSYFTVYSTIIIFHVTMVDILTGFKTIVLW